jgi:glycerophosphoryl diester phosphodiesterase
MKKILGFVLVVSILLSFCGCGGVYGDTIKIEKKGALMIAHRGLSGMEVENTASAFIAAAERSYYGIEGDVRRTADGKYVMCHDENLYKLSGRSVKVEESTLEELLSIDLFSKRFWESEHLIDLQGYIEICKRYDKQAILEFKSEFTEEEIGEIVAIICDMGYIERVTFISFYYKDLLCVRKHLPDQSVQYLFSELTEETAQMLIRDKIDPSVYHKALTKEVVDRFHDAGLMVNCWTIDGISDADRFIDMGVDFITTNILE